MCPVNHFGELLETEEKQTLGMLSKMLLDHARLLWLRARGWQVGDAWCVWTMRMQVQPVCHALLYTRCTRQADMVVYAPPHVTGENRLLVARRQPMQRHT